MRKYIQLSFGTLSTNYHGRKDSGLYSGKTLRRTVRLTRMGSYAKYWTLYIYRGDGRAHMIGVAFPRWLGPWPKSAGGEPRP